MRRFLKSEDGGATVEFVAIMFFFTVVVFMIIQLALALFWWQTAVKAAAVGARYAATTDPVKTGLPSVNPPSDSSVIYGTACTGATSGDPCSGFGTITYTTAQQTQSSFNDIFCRMKAVLPNLQPKYITITYTYVGLGFVGGPPVPAVTVTISGVPFPTGFSDVFGPIFGHALTTIPTMSATMTGEDLNTNNQDSVGTGTTGFWNTSCSGPAQ